MGRGYAIGSNCDFVQQEDVVRPLLLSFVGKDRSMAEHFTDKGQRKGKQHGHKQEKAVELEVLAIDKQ